MTKTKCGRSHYTNMPIHIVLSRALKPQRLCEFFLVFTLSLLAGIISVVLFLKECVCSHPVLPWVQTDLYLWFWGLIPLPGVMSWNHTSVITYSTSSYMYKHTHMYTDYTGGTQLDQDKLQNLRVRCCSSELYVNLAYVCILASKHKQLRISMIGSHVIYISHMLHTYIHT